MQTTVFIDGWKIIIDGERIDGVTIEKFDNDALTHTWPYVIPDVSYTRSLGNFRTWASGSSHKEPPPDDFQGALV